MGKINIEEELKKAEQVKKEFKNIESKRIGEKTFFRGKFVEDWFEDYGECVKANADFVRQQEYKNSGLNEHGQDKKGEERSRKIKALIEKKEVLLKQINEIDIEISQVNLRKDDDETVEEKPKKNASKK